MHDFLQHDRHVVFVTDLNQWTRALVQLHQPLLNQGGQFEATANFANNIFLFKLFVHPVSLRTFEYLTNVGRRLFDRMIDYHMLIAGRRVQLFF